MKKVLCLLMVLTMAMGCISIGASAAEYGIVLNNNVALVVGNTAAVANNTLCTLSAAPIEEDGEILIPLNAVSDLLKGTVSQNGNVIEVSFGMDKKVSMIAGSKTYTYNGRGYTFDVAPREANGVIMVPLSFIAKDVIGKTVFYDPTTKVVIISDKAVIKNALTDAAVLSTIASAIASRVLPEITVPTSYELDWGTVEDVVIGGTGSTAAPTVQTVKATVASVSASQEPEIENNGPKAFDGDIGSRWACDGDGEIVADLGSVQTIVNIKIAWWKWEERSAKYDLEISTDGANYTTVFSGNAEGQFYEEHAVNQQARYVKIKSHGNTSSNWNSLLECEIYVPGASSNNASTGASGGKVSSASGTKVTVSGSMVTASAEPESQNPGRNIADGNSTSVWAAEGSANATIDLGSVMPVSCVGVQMKAYDDGRAIKFGVSVSEDGASYSSAFDGQSVDNGGTMEYISVGKNARYVRINVNGSTTGNWSSVAEVEVYTGAASDNAASGTVTSYPNKSSVSGEFILAPVGSADVLTVGSDNMTLTVTGNTKDPKQTWSLNGNAVMNKGTGYCMDVFEMSYDEGGQIGVWEGNGGDNQSWTFENDGDGYYIKSNMSGLYLTVSGGSVQQRSRGSATKWVVADPSATPVTTGGSSNSTVTSYPNKPSVSGEFILAPVGSADVLTVGSDNLTLSVTGNTKDPKQTWSLEGNSVKNKGTGFCMDVSEMSYDEGGSIIVWEGNGGDNQSWTFENDGNGYYIKSNMSGLYLTVSGGSVQQRSKGSATKWVVADPNATPVTTGGTVINGEFKIRELGTKNALTVESDNLTLSVKAESSSKRQLWTSGRNSYGDTFHNVGADLFMDVSGQSMDEGGSIIVWEGNDGNNQSWAFEAADEGYYIRSVMSGLYLANVNGGVQQLSRSNATKWEIKGDDVQIVTAPVDPNVPVVITEPIEGAFKALIYGTNDALTLANNGTTVKVERYSSDKSNQTWTMTEAEGGMNIVSEWDTLLDVVQKSSDESYRACASVADGSASQAWVVEKVGKFYYIKNANSGYYLSYDGENVRQKSFAYATKWALKSVK